MIHRVKYLLIVLVCLALVIPALSCALQPGARGLELRLEKAPCLNETVKLTCTHSIRVANLLEGMTSNNISHEKIELSYEKIELDFRRIDPKTGYWVFVQPEEILVDGNFNWEADIKIDESNHRIEVSPQDVSADGDLDWEAVAKWGVPLEFSAIVKFPHEGNWRLCTTSTSLVWDSDCVLFHVGKDSGSFDLEEDYRPNTGPYPDTPSEEFPMTVQVDIPKAPRLDEAVELTWTINSIRDIADVNGWVNFRRMEGAEEVEVPAEDILVEGDLNWEGSLKKDTPVQLSAIIRFPAEGDWEIEARARSPEQEGGCADGLFLNVGKEKGRWGWVEPHEKERPLQPPPLHK